MAHSIRHTFVSPVADTGNPNEVGPDEWNAAHTVTLDADELLTSLKTVDGAGSGLDADLLDGMSSTAFAAASHTHTLSAITDAGTAAAKNTGTSGNTVPLLDGTNTWSAAQTFGAAVNVSGLTASSAVATDGSKNLISVTNTGTGNNVLATSPTLVTPTLGAASATSLTLTNDLAVADGGTGASTARGAQANLLGWYVLAASGVQVSHTGTTAETTLATVTIPAGAMGANGAIRISSVWSNNNSGNNKTFRARLDGLAGSIMYSGVVTTTVSFNDPPRLIQNRNSVSSQVGRNAGSSGAGSSGSSIYTSSADTSAAVDIVFTAQLANTGDTARLEGYVVELFYAA
jgi:hypothetical protein